KSMWVVADKVEYAEVSNHTIVGGNAMNSVEVKEPVQLPPAARFHISKLEDKYREQVLAMASMLVSLVDLKDCYTGGHSTRVATYSRLIALELNLDEAELETVVMAASLHDIGKIGVPDH